MKNVETISLDLSICGKNWFTAEIFDQMKKVFANMKKLRLLKVYYSDHYKDCLHQEGHKFKMPLPKDFEFPPNLKFLHWDGLESLPLNFHGENLIAINLKSSDIKELLREEKVYNQYLVNYCFMSIFNYMEVSFLFQNITIKALNFHLFTFLS